MDKKLVFFVLETQKTKNGEYIPLIAVEGEAGYNITDWAWGTEFAQAEQIADHRNQVMGIDKKESLRVILGTMRPRKAAHV